jgi:Phage integrase family.
MPLDEMPTFMLALGAYDGDLRTRLALRLMVLTFARTTELRAARWPEFENLDGNEPVWRYPGGTYQNEARTPCSASTAALAVLRELRELPGSDCPACFYFPQRHSKNA